MSELDLAAIETERDRIRATYLLEGDARPPSTARGLHHFAIVARDVEETVKFYSGDLSQFVNEQLRPAFGSIWFVGGGTVAGECLRRGLADEIRYSILPILIGDGIPFFEKLGRDVPLHLAEVKAYKNGIVELRYDVPKKS